MTLLEVHQALVESPVNASPAMAMLKTIAASVLHDQGQSAAFDDPQGAEVRPSARLDSPGRGDLRRPDHQKVRRTLAIAHAANPSR